MNVTMKQLRAFREVAKSASFSRASEKLHIAQSAISALVRELERELSARLFDRTTRRVELTAAGREFLPQVEKIISDLEHAVQDTHDLGQRRRGRLTVAGPPLLIEALIPKVLVPFKHDFPGVRVEIIDARDERIVEAVKTGQADIGIGSFTHADEELSRTRLARDTLSLFCASNHRLAKLRAPKWSDIDGVPLISLTRDSGIRQLVDFGCKSSGISSQPEYEVALVTTALALVGVGIGIAVLPTNSIAAIRGRSIVSRPLSHPTVVREITMISRDGRSLSPAAAEWVHRLKREMKTLTDDL
jgi:DNA-binding transcriptional LysR family regulator